MLEFIFVVVVAAAIYYQQRSSGLSREVVNLSRKLEDRTRSEKGLVRELTEVDRASARSDGSKDALARELTAAKRDLEDCRRADRVHTERSVGDIGRFCRPQYRISNGMSREAFAVDFADMSYEHFSVFDVVGHAHRYALWRSVNGEWRSKLLEVEILGEQYDDDTGKLMHGRRLSPQAWADKEYPVEESWFDSEIDRVFRLEERAEVLEWTALPERLVPWIETSYQRCAEFFQEHEGWTPATTLSELPTGSTVVWTPPLSEEGEADIQASFERLTQARRKTLDLKRELNSLTNRLLKEHQEKQAGRPAPS